MLIPHVVATEADKVFVNILNVQAASVTDGEAVVWDTGTPDGVRATQAATATLGLFIGLVQGTIAAGAYGLAQVYGYKATGRFSGESETVAVAGAMLLPVAAADHLAVAGGATNPSIVAAASGGAPTGFLYLAESLAASEGEAAAKVFIRAL